MEYTEESLVNFELKGTSKEEKEKKYIKRIYEHKWISMIVISLILLSSINVIMIYNFFRILQKI